MSEELSRENSDEYLEKFGYRSYNGPRQGRGSRVISSLEFELKGTWRKSTFGKVLLVILMVVNILMIFIFTAFPIDIIFASERDTMNGFVANYARFGDAYISSSTDVSLGELGPNVGIFLIILFAIAGSGLFADDKNGKVIELYLARLTKREYILGKVGSILIYINLFILGPLLITSIIMIESFDGSHFDFIGFYIGLIWFSLLFSLVLGLGILLLSALAEKRNYASLGFFLIFMLGSIFGQIVLELSPDNEFYLLISPSNFLVLLSLVCLGDYDIGIGRAGFDGFGQRKQLLLNDGSGLEFYHVYGLAFAYIFIFASLLYLKIRKLTTEEL